MSRGRRALAFATFAVVGIAGWSARAAQQQREPIVTRSFTILAEAFPEAPVPGRGSTELGPKPLGSRVTVSNAPASAYGRSAVSDNGTIELYTGPPPPETIAECDTTSTNLPRDAVKDVGGAHLTAHCDDAPMSNVSAAGAMPGNGGGSGSSFASGDGGSDAAIGTATATANDVTVGPMHIGSARYEASARADGTREGAAGAGHVAVSDATVNGTPVIIGPDGVRVDQSKVPTELVNAATHGVQTALGQGGYLNVRVAQPEVTIADDGSTVSVRGGGVFFEGQSNDPTQPYFLRETLVGGALSVAVGADLSTARAVPVTHPDAAPSETAPQPPAPLLRSPDVVVAAPAAPSDVIAQTTVHHRKPYGIGWLWIVVAAAVGGSLMTVFRRKLEPPWSAFADRYLRG